MNRATILAADRKGAISSAKIKSSQPNPMLRPFVRTVLENDSNEWQHHKVWWEKIFLHFVGMNLIL